MLMENFRHWLGTSPPPLACSGFDGVNDCRETYAFQIGAGFGEAACFYRLPKGGGGEA